VSRGEQRHAEIVVNRIILRIDFKTFLVVGNRFFESSGPGQRDGQVVLERRIVGLFLDQLSPFGDRGGVLTALAVNCRLIEFAVHIQDRRADLEQSIGRDIDELG
jgi:hypothetical protein